MRHNSAALDASAEVTKVNNHTLPDTLRMLLISDLEQDLGIHISRSTWSCLIIKVLETWGKFLQPSGNSTEINCAFTFCTTNVFSFFYGVMTQFKVFHSVNCFSHVIYNLQTSMYQNIVKLLTCPHKISL